MTFVARSVIGPKIAAAGLLVAVAAWSTAAQAAPELPPETSGAEPEAPSDAIPAPEANPEAGPQAGSEVPPPAEVAVPEPAAPPSEGAPAPAPEGEVPVQSPTTATDVTAPTADADAPPASPAESEPAVDPSLLDAAEPEPEATAPVRTQPASGSNSDLSPEERAEAIDAAYAAKYRPADNPLRMNIAARVLFANVSGGDGVNGRIGGASVDVGPAWNRFGFAATLTGWGGRLQLPEGSGAEMNAMLGGGLSAGLGRLALMTHGYVDLRVGYDIYYGVVNQRSDVSGVLAPQADGDDEVIVALTENLLPHGPRVRLDLGLVGAGHRRFFHGFGLSMGYQALVGSARGYLPPTSMLTLGFSYFMG